MQDSNFYRAEDFARPCATMKAPNSAKRFPQALIRKSELAYYFFRISISLTVKVTAP